jgi:hypothetical protein
MGHERYRLLAYWLGALVTFTLLFPFLVFGIVKLSSCHGVGGACGAMAAIVGMTVRPLCIAILIIGLAIASWRRVRGAGLSVLWFTAIVLWLIGSSTFLIGFGDFWGANFGMGLIFLNFPILFFFLLVFLAFLASNFEGATIQPQTTARSWTIAAAATLGLLLSIRHASGGERLLVWPTWADNSLG